MTKQQNDLIVAVGFSIFLISVISYSILTGQFSSKTWLPDPNARLNQGFALANLPVKSEVVQTDYGPAKKYTSSERWQTIYEFRSSPFLKASTCPNITNIEPLESDWCMPVGISHGAMVYAINRRLPSGITEYYTKRGGTFIYVKSGGVGGSSLDYLNSFSPISEENISGYLLDNRKRIEELL